MIANLPLQKIIHIKQSTHFSNFHQTIYLYSNAFLIELNAYTFT